MTGPEFAELTGWISDRWGNDRVWTGAQKFAADFRTLEADIVWESVYELAATDGKFAPRPTEIVSLAARKRRAQFDPTRQTALPQATGGGTYAEWSEATFGEVVPMAEAIRRRHERIQSCKSPHCDIHLDAPLPVPAEFTKVTP